MRCGCLVSAKRRKGPRSLLPPRCAKVTDVEIIVQEPRNQQGGPFLCSSSCKVLYFSSNDLLGGRPSYGSFAASAEELPLRGLDLKISYRSKRPFSVWHSSKLSRAFRLVSREARPTSNLNSMPRRNYQSSPTRYPQHFTMIRCLTESIRV